MTTLNELASQLRSHAPHSGSERPRSWLARHCDLLVLLLFVLASIDPVWLSPRMPFVVHGTFLTDDSWHVDEVFKLSRGIWVGRDVAFTHGPIYQWLSSVPARLLGVSMGAVYATWDIVPVWCAFVIVCLTLRLLLAEQPAWKRALLLFLLIVFWLVYREFSLQNAFPVLLFAIFLRGWYAVTEGHAKSYALGSVAALLCVVAFLISSDAGAYSAAAWVIATAAICFEEGRNKRVAGRCIVAWTAYAVSGLVFALAVHAAMGGTFDFRFWKESAQIVSVYRWATPTAMTHAGTVRLLGTLFAGAAVFLFRAGTRSKRNPATTERAAFLLGGFAFAAVMLQSALVRSDIGHVQSGSLAMVLLTGTVLFSFQSARISSAAVLLAILCSVLFSGPAFGPGTAMRAVRQLWQPKTLCPAGFREFDRACFAPEFTAMLQSVTGYLDRHSRPQEHIVVFPYQTLFGIASQRSVAGGLMQAYTASGPYLSQLEIAGLETTPAPTGVYATDLAWVSETETVPWRNRP
jgi:hypothetical protein